MSEKNMCENWLHMRMMDDRNGATAISLADAVEKGTRDELAKSISGLLASLD
jgi:hypothetical protein